MTISLTKTKLLAIASSLTLFACSSDDDSGNGSSNANCNAPALIDQVAQGSFRGADFTVQGGSYRAQTIANVEQFFCSIHVKEVIGGSCAFPDFEGTDDTVIFQLSTLDVPQTITFTDEFNGVGQALNFNRISANGTEVELACGTLTITALDALTNQLSGNVTADGAEGSIINGNFVLELCN